MSNPNPIAVPAPPEGDDVLLKTDLARMFRCSLRTIGRMVERRDIPEPIPCAGKAVWLRGAFFAHLRERAKRVERTAGTTTNVNDILNER